MVFYSRNVVYDIHLYSEVVEEIKINQVDSSAISVGEIGKVDLFSDSSLTLICTDINKIKWASKNTSEIFGYTSHDEVVHLPITTLMPPYFAKRHDRYVSKWMESGRYSKLNSTSYLWGMHREGNCFTLKSYLKLVHLPHEGDYGIIASMQQLQQ